MLQLFLAAYALAVAFGAPERKETRHVFQYAGSLCEPGSPLLQVVVSFKVVECTPEPCHMATVNGVSAMTQIECGSKIETPLPDHAMATVNCYTEKEYCPTRTIDEIRFFPLDVPVPLKSGINVTFSYVAPSVMTGSLQSHLDDVIIDNPYYEILQVHPGGKTEKSELEIGENDCEYQFKMEPLSGANYISPIALKGLKEKEPKTPLSFVMLFLPPAILLLGVLLALLAGKLSPDL